MSNLAWINEAMHFLVSDLRVEDYDTVADVTGITFALHFEDGSNGTIHIETVEEGL